MIRVDIDVDKGTIKYFINHTDYENAFREIDFFNVLRYKMTIYCGDSEMSIKLISFVKFIA